MVKAAGHATLEVINLLEERIELLALVHHHLAVLHRSPTTLQFECYSLNSRKNLLIAPPRPFAIKERRRWASCRSLQSGG